MTHATQSDLAHLQGVRSTPLLLLDLDAVADNYRTFASAFPGVQVHYAVKCNPDLAVLETLRGLGCGFEIASYRELELLAAIGVPAKDVLFSNPVRSRGQIRDCREQGVQRFSVDSPSELRKLAEVAPGADFYVRMRTTPANSLVPSEGKFGAPVKDCLGLLLLGRELGLRPHGLTFHVGSQMTDLFAWDQPFADAGHLMRQALEFDIRLSMVDVGGGFPAHYTSDVPPLDVFGSRICALAKELPYEVTLAAEPGRALVATAGRLVTTVIGVVERAGIYWAHTDVGVFNGFMEVLESAGELRYPVVDNRSDQEKRLYNLTGPTCDSQDTFALDVELSASLAEGDVLTISSAGAYTTAYASTFNGFDIPETVAMSVASTGAAQPSSEEA